MEEEKENIPEEKPVRRTSKPFLLIETFSQVWSKAYGGQVYEKTPRDFKHAKLYLEINDDFSPDNIVEKAQIYLSKNGFFAENRHNFTSFINNISSFVDEKPKQIAKKIKCQYCFKEMFESQQYEHWNSCTKMRSTNETPGADRPLGVERTPKTMQEILAKTIPPDGR